MVTLERKLARALVLIGVLLFAATGAAMAAVDSYDATDRELVEEWLRLLKEKDRAALDEFLSPGLLVTRGDGTHLTKEEYLDNPVIIDEYEISNVFGRGVGDVRVVRYDVASIEWIDGIELTRDPVVRMSVFHWNGERWQLIAHSNFINIRQ